MLTIHIFIGSLSVLIGGISATASGLMAGAGAPLDVSHVNGRACEIVRSIQSASGREFRRRLDDFLLDPNQAHDFLTNSVLKPISDTLPELPAETMWRALCGPELMELVGSQLRAYARLSKLVIVLATNIPINWEERRRMEAVSGKSAELHFAETTRFARFCTTHESVIREWIVNFHAEDWFLRRVPTDMSNFGRFSTSATRAFAARLPMYCPNLFTDSMPLKAVAIAHDMYRLAVTEMSPKDTSLRFMGINRKTAFWEMLGLLNGREAAVRLGISAATFRDEEGYGPGVQRELILEAVKEIFGPLRLFVPGALGELDTSVGEAKTYTLFAPMDEPEYRLDEYRGVGRLMALGLVQRAPVALGFPVMMYAKLLNRDVAMKDILEDEPLLYDSLSKTLLFDNDTLEHKRLFLQFVTGSSHVPAVGFGATERPIKIEFNQFASDKSLPTARTCFYELTLPPYLDMATLAEKLTTAVEGVMSLTNEAPIYSDE